MTDQWMLRGSEFANCNCDYGCPCQFGSPSTYGTCEAISSIQVDEGYFNDTKLDGLSFVILMKWPGEIAEGNGQTQLIINANADEGQRAGLQKIALGESTAPGATHFNVFAGTMKETFDTLYLPIEMSIDVDGRKGSARIEGMVESEGVPIKNSFDGSDVHARIHLPDGFEYTYAEMGSGTSKCSGNIDLDLNDSYGQFCVLQMNQDGVIR